MNATTKNSPRERLPLHMFLHRRLKQLADVKNVDVARALDYPKPNVVAMIFSGSMKLPLDKVPAMARALELDNAALLRRALEEYYPGVLPIIEEALGRTAMLTTNQRDLLAFCDAQLDGEDVPLVSDPSFRAALEELLERRRASHLRELIALRPGDDARPRGAATSLRQQVIERMRKNATERARSTVFRRERDKGHGDLPDGD